MSENQINKPKGWTSQFSLIGTVKPTDTTFKINQKNEGSHWEFSSMNLGVFCGEKFGTIFTDCMAGHDDRDGKTVLYVNGKKEDGSTDWENRFELDWENRFDENELANIGKNCFFNVGLERDDNGKLFIKRFLSPYDAIAYIQEHLATDKETVVNVKGNLKYSFYNDKVQVKKEVTGIYLSDKEPSDYCATFTQSVLLNKESAPAKDIDKETGILQVNGTVIDYINKFNGVEFKSNYPFSFPFEFEFDLSKPELVQKAYELMFKYKSNKYTMLTFVGDLIESGATILPTMDDVPDEIKALIAAGVYSEEEALKKCADNGNKTKRMVLRKPEIRLNDNKTPVIQKFDDVFEEDDLNITLPTSVDNVIDEVVEEGTVVATDGSMDWLNQL